MNLNIACIQMAQCCVVMDPEFVGDVISIIGAYFGMFEFELLHCDIMSSI